MTIRPLMMTAALAAASAAAACANQAGYENADLYHGFTRIDPEAEQMIENAYVVVKDGVIVDVGAGAPPMQGVSTRHDMSGRYALPGLIDMHAHISLGPVSVRMENDLPVLFIDYDRDITEHNGRLLLAHGVTTIRDPGGEAAVNVAYRRDVEAGRLLGPEARVAGRVIDRSPVVFDGLVDNVSEDRPIEDIIRDQAAAGVDYVKFYFSLTAEDLARGQAAADEIGIPTIGHVGVNWKTAAEIGLDALVHAMPTNAELLAPELRETYLETRRPGAFEFFEWWEQADLASPEMRDMIETVARERVIFDGTLIAFYLAFWGDAPEVRDAYIELAHPAMVENWNTAFRFDLGWTADDYDRAKAVWPKVERFMKMMYDAGAVMTLGTDAGNPFVAPGASLMQEMELHSRAGVPAWAILRMATADAADALDLGDRIGRIEKGYEADIVFMHDDPLADFMALTAADIVLHNGRALDASALKAGMED